LLIEKINTNWHLYQSRIRNIPKSCNTLGKVETIGKKYHQNALIMYKPVEVVIFIHLIGYKKRTKFNIFASLKLFNISSNYEYRRTERT